MSSSSKVNTICFPHQWTRLRDCLGDCSKHTMVYYNNALWTFGGDGGRNMLNQLLRYDITTDTWSHPPCYGTLPAARYHHTAVVWSDRMLIFGGYTGDLPSSPNLTNKNDLFEYYFPTGEWREWDMNKQNMSRLPAPRAAHGAVVYDNKMWIFGGYDGNFRLNDMWFINLSNTSVAHSHFHCHNNTNNGSHQCVACPLGCEVAAASRPRSGMVDSQPSLSTTVTTDSHRAADSSSMPALSQGRQLWFSIKQQGELPPPCLNFAMCVLNESIYLFSGHSGASINNKLYRFDFSTYNWTRINTHDVLSAGTPAPEKRYGHTMIAFRRYLYVFGGATGGPTLPNQLHRYDTETQSWSEEAPYTSLLPTGFTMTSPNTNSPLSSSSSSSNVINTTTTTTTTTVSALVPRGRLFHAAACVNDVMYILGGTMETNRELFSCQLADYPACSLRQDLSQLLSQAPLYCDVTFHIPLSESNPLETVAVPAHMAVVVARCSYLRDFIQKARENNNDSSSMEMNVMLHVHLPFTVNPIAFPYILNYLYTDRIVPTDPNPMSKMEEANNNQDSHSPEVLTKMIAVYELAIRFGLRRLTGMFSHYFDSVISIRNALPALQMAFDMKLRCLQSHCIRFIIKDSHYNNILNMDEFSSLSKQLIVEIARCRENPNILSTTSTDDDTLSDLTTEITNEGSLEQDLALLLTSELGSQFSDIRLKLISSSSSSSSQKLLDSADHHHHHHHQLVNDQKDQINSPTFPAHKAILAARSEYFRGLFRSREYDRTITNTTTTTTGGNNGEGGGGPLGEATTTTTDVILIDGVGPVGPNSSRHAFTELPSFNSVSLSQDVSWPPMPERAFSFLLQYLYTGDIGCMNLEESLYLFTVPHYYGLTNTRLQAFCKKNLEANICEENALDILLAADQVQAVTMKEYALDLIFTQPAKILLPARALIENFPKHLIVDLLYHRISASMEVTYHHSSFPHNNSINNNNNNNNDFRSSTTPTSSRSPLSRCQQQSTSNSVVTSIPRVFQRQSTTSSSGGAGSGNGNSGGGGGNNNNNGSGGIGSSQRLRKSTGSTGGSSWGQKR